MALAAKATPTMNTTDAENRTLSGWVKWATIGLALAGLIALWSVLPIQLWIEQFQTWVQSLGTTGIIVFIAVYAIATFFLFPGSPLSLVAAVAWGFWAFPIVIVAAIIGSSISFLAARHIFYDRVQAKIKAYPKFSAVNEAIRDEGWRVIALLRLSPALPFSLQNWFLGITPVGFWPSQITTFFCIMPGTLLYIWIGTLGSTAGGEDMSTYKYIAYGVGLAATLAVTILVSRAAAKKLREATHEEV